jgi:hypothetical protein
MGQTETFGPFRSTTALPSTADIARTCGYFREVPCMDGARGAREENLTFSRNDTGAAMYPAFKRSRCGCWP